MRDEGWEEAIREDAAEQRPHGYFGRKGDPPKRYESVQLAGQREFLGVAHVCGWAARLSGSLWDLCMAARCKVSKDRLLPARVFAHLPTHPADMIRMTYIPFYRQGIGA